jgi:deazaflavin-dependent oxidoreductase (nitroreductase family)
MQMPRAVARLNRRVVNPIQGAYAWLLPPWAVIVHRGRRTGRAYRTPVLAFVRGRVIAVAILYGAESDWVKNVLAGGGHVVRLGRTYELVAPQVVDARSASEASALARRLGRVSGRLLVASLGDAAPGIGRGPAAGR